MKYSINSPSKWNGNYQSELMWHTTQQIQRALCLFEKLKHHIF